MARTGILRIFHYDVPMRWITFAILLYLASALQSTNFAGLGRHYPHLEYLILLAVFYGLYAAEDSAMLAGLCCGLAYDLTNDVLVGTFTVPLALLTWGVVRVRMGIFRDQKISQLIITLLAVVTVGLLATILRECVEWITNAPDGPGIFRTKVINALYTGVVAPGVFWLLFKLRPILGFAAHSRRM